MKILLLDIETAPNLAYVWGLWKENIPTARIVNNGYVLCWAAKWHKKSQVQWSSIHTERPRRMLQRIHTMLNQADVVVHYNGKSFDIPTLNKEFITHGFKPPAPYKQVDLLSAVRSQFRFPSNKLDYVLQTLKLGQKVRHTGFEMWVQCMAGDKAAWDLMKEYNIGDVHGLERLYEKMLPWIPGHPSHGAHDKTVVCPQCGGHHYTRHGYRVLRLYKYPRYQCNGCGHWFRDTRTVTQKKLQRFV